MTGDRPQDGMWPKQNAGSPQIMTGHLGTVQSCDRPPKSTCNLDSKAGGPSPWSHDGILVLGIRLTFMVVCGIPWSCDHDLRWFLLETGFCFWLPGRNIHCDQWVCLTTAMFALQLQDLLNNYCKRCHQIGWVIWVPRLITAMTYDENSGLYDSLKLRTTYCN